MPDLPYIQFFPADWLQDTRVLSLSAKGAWIDLLCAMWTARERGLLRMRLSAYGRLIGTTDERTAQILAELHDLGVAERETAADGTIVMWCRRMVRHAGVLEAQAAQRKDQATRAARTRWGNPAPPEPSGPSARSGGHAPGMLRACSEHSSGHAIPESRSQSTEKRRKETSSLPSAPDGMNSAPAHTEPMPVDSPPWDPPFHGGGTHHGEAPSSGRTDSSGRTPQPGKARQPGNAAPRGTTGRPMEPTPGGRLPQPRTAVHGGLAPQPAGNAHPGTTDGPPQHRPHAESEAYPATADHGESGTFPGNPGPAESGKHPGHADQAMCCPGQAAHTGGDGFPAESRFAAGPGLPAGPRGPGAPGAWEGGPYPGGRSSADGGSMDAGIDYHGHRSPDSVRPSGSGGTPTAASPFPAGMTGPIHPAAAARALAAMRDGGSALHEGPDTGSTYHGHRSQASVRPSGPGDTPATVGTPFPAGMTGPIHPAAAARALAAMRDGGAVHGDGDVPDAESTYHGHRSPDSGRPAGRGYHEDRSTGSRLPSGPGAGGIAWSAQGFTGITPGDLAAWAEAFPALDLRSQTARAHQWLLANPRKRKRSIRRFLVNWFARSQERGGDRAPSAATPRGPRPPGPRHRDGYAEDIPLD